MSTRRILDRSIVQTLSNPDDTASRNDGISPQTERRHRLHGTSLIYEACRVLKVPCLATACTIFHRAYYRISLRRMDVWSAAMASTLLAIKIEELQVNIRQLIIVFAHIYRRRQLVLIHDNDRDNVSAQPFVARTDISMRPFTEKQSHLQNSPPLTLCPLGPIWREWHLAVIDAESSILHHLGYVVYWIPDHHPHKFILYILRILEAQSLAQSAFDFCNDACRLDLCTRYDSHVIACAAVHLASLQSSCDGGGNGSGHGGSSDQLSLPSQRWWNIICGPNHDDDLGMIANALLGLQDSTNMDIVSATHAFLPSLVTNGSFNDPDSFVWEMSTSTWGKLS